MRRKVLTGLLTTAISVNPISFGNVFAEGEQVESRLLQEKNTVTNSIRMLGSQFPLIQAYGLVILKQPDVKIEAMNSLTNHQKFAKNNVSEWMDEYTPGLIALNQEMMQFSTRFNNYYSRLYDLAGILKEDKQAKENFVSAFSKIQGQGQTIQSSIEQTMLKINYFNTLLANDGKKLSERAEEAIKSLKGSNGNIQQLRENIKRIQVEIQVELTKILSRPNGIIKGSINIGKQIIKTTSTTVQTKNVDFVSIESLSEELQKGSDSQVTESAYIIQQKQKELVPMIQSLSEAQIQVTEITVVESQIKDFMELIKRQIMTLESVMSDWKAINEVMSQIKMNLVTDEQKGSESLQQQLIHLKKISDETKKQTNQFEDFVTNVEIKEV
ncbi:HBL/NHE enterotoxin family protein (plasmid) [Bacillus mycoides]|nr:HBL/NHE enterotoxin family protein [Bacillus mycoides]